MKNAFFKKIIPVLIIGFVWISARSVFAQASSSNSVLPMFPDGGLNPNTYANPSILIWGILGGILIALVITFFVIRKKQ